MGRYVPPDQEGVVSANQLAGKHALGSRARNLHTTGAITVRFEMPFPVWCHTCKPPSSTSTASARDKSEREQRTDDDDCVLIGQGVRFNAEKKKVGNYYSTPIWSFRMKHSVCGGWIEIRTNPKNAEYVVVEGGRRRAQAVDTMGPDGPLGLWIEEGGGAGANEIHVRKPGEKEGEGGRDPFAKLETKITDERGFMTAKTRMQELRKRQERDWGDPYEQSKKLRKVFRAERKDREDVQGRTDALRNKMGLGIELVEESEADRLRAGMVQFGKDSGGNMVASRRGLFDSGPRKMLEDGKKKRHRKKTAAETALERKNLLQKELSGNTRAVIDPFLNDEKVWQPGFSVKRKTGNKNGTPAVSSLTPETGSDYDKGRPAQEEVEAKPPDTVKPAQQHSTVLVEYGSDSD